MSRSLGYIRKFIIFKKDYSNMHVHNPRGHGKIEIKGVKGNITINIENAEPDNFYNIAFVDKRNAEIIGKIYTEENGKGKADIVYNLSDLEAKGFSADEINGILIFRDSDVLLGGYIIKEDNSIEEFIQQLPKEVVQAKAREVVIDEVEKFEEAAEIQEELKEAAETQEEFKEVEVKIEKHLEETDIEPIKEVVQLVEGIEKPVEEIVAPEEEIVESQLEIVEHEEMAEEIEEVVEVMAVVDDVLPPIELTMEEYQPEEFVPEEYMVPAVESIPEEYMVPAVESIPEEELTPVLEGYKAAEFPMEIEFEEAPYEESLVGHTPAVESISEEILITDPIVQMSSSTTYGYDNIELNRKVAQKNQTTDYILSILRYFPYIEPFELDLYGYNWWKIDFEDNEDPRGFLPYFSLLIGGDQKYNRIYDTSATAKDLMIRYEHYIFGLYNVNDEVKFYVYGVPGAFSKEDHPHKGTTGFNTWFEGKDVDGYWLLYIDPLHGKVIYPANPMIPNK